MLRLVVLTLHKLKKKTLKREYFEKQGLFSAKDFGVCIGTTDNARKWNVALSSGSHVTINLKIIKARIYRDAGIIFD